MSFRTLCMSRLSDELALSEDLVARFTDTFIEIANQTIPKSHISKNKLPKVPWFNDACKPVSYTHLTLPTRRTV